MRTGVGEFVSTTFFFENGDLRRLGTARRWKRPVCLSRAVLTPETCVESV